MSQGMINANTGFFSSNSPHSGQVLSGVILTWRDLFLALVACVPFFLNLNYLQIMGSEDRWITVSQKMLETREWLEPIRVDAFYGDKPLLSYWIIVLTALPFDRVTEGIARFPSALSGAVTVLMTTWLGARLFGRGVAVLSAFILATAISFLVWSRQATADVMNVAFITASICTYVSWRNNDRPWKLVAFFLLLSVGGHAKGMPAVIVPLGIVLADLFIHVMLARGRMGRGTSIRNHVGGIIKPGMALLRKQLPWILLGLVTSVALYLLPFYLSYLKRGNWQLLTLMYRENVTRAFQAFDHREPIYDYLKVLPGMFLPWSLWAPGALGWAAKRFQKHGGFQFTLLSFVVIFLLFTASSSRRSYYILPIFPFAAILVAGFIENMLYPARTCEHPRALWRLFCLVPVKVLGSLLTMGAVILLIGPFLPGRPGKLLGTLPYVTSLGIVLGVAASFFWISWKRRSECSQVVAVVITAFLIALYISTGGQILKQQRLTERSFAAAVQEKFPTLGAPLYFGRVNGRLKYYLGQNQDMGSLRELGEVIKGEQETLVVTEWRSMPKLEAAEWLSVNEILRAEKPALPLFKKPEPTYLLISCKRK